MATRITLNIFSGRPNPTWTLTGADEKKLTDRLASLETATDRRPSGVFGGLGYRGFTIARSVKGAKSMATVHESIVDRAGADFNVVDETGIEAFLVGTAGGRVPEEVLAYLSQNTGDAAKVKPFKLPKIPLKPLCPMCKAADAPVYNPGVWNTPAVQPKNNCYNYANNKITNTFAQPGRAHGKQAKKMQCPNVVLAAKADGLVAVPSFSATLGKGRGWYVALVVWPNVDYHWYRQDKVGCWSHKPGQTAARNVDNSGKRIRNPKTCDRGPYTHFCTFMVTRKGLKIS